MNEKKFHNTVSKRTDPKQKGRRDEIDIGGGNKEDSGDEEGGFDNP